MGPAVLLPVLAFQRYCRRPGNAMRERGMESQRHPRQSVPSRDGLWLTDPGYSLRGVRDEVICVARVVRGLPSQTLILRSRASGVLKDGLHTPTETLSCNRHRIFANTCGLQEREAICMNELGSSRS